MARRGEIVVGGDTTGAVKSLNTLEGSFTELKSKLDLLGQGFTAVAGVMSGFFDQARQTAKLRVQVEKLGGSGRAQLLAMRDATNDLISSDQLMRASFALTKNGLQLTQQQLEAVTKAAVEFSRGTGGIEDTGTILDRLTKGITGGTVSAVNDFGFALDESGTIAQKQQRILDSLVSKYGDVTISVKGLEEQIVSSDNAFTASRIQKTDNVEKVAGAWKTFKDVLKESAANMLSFKGEAAEMYEWLDKLREGAEDVTDSGIKFGRQIGDLIVKRAQLRDQGYENSIEYQTLTKKEIDLTKKYINSKKSQVMADRVAAEERIKYLEEQAAAAEREHHATKELLPEWKEAQALKKDMAATNKRLTETIKREEQALKDLESTYTSTSLAIELAQNRIKKSILDTLGQGVKLVKQYDNRQKAIEAAKKAAAKAEEAARKVYKDQLTLIKKRMEIYEEEGMAIPKIVLDEKLRLQLILDMTTAERNRFMLYESAEKANKTLTDAQIKATQDRLKAEKEFADFATGTWNKMIAERKKKALDSYNLRKLQLSQSRKILEINRQLADMTAGTTAKQKLENEIKTKKLQIQREQINLDRLIKEGKFSEAETSQVAINGINDEIYARQRAIAAIDAQKAKQKELNEQVKKFTDSKPYKAFADAASGAMMSVSKAIFMTDKELEKSGKSRSQMLEQQLYEWLRNTGSQLVGDGVKNILMGTAKAVIGDPAGAAQSAVGVVEIGAGIAMGGIGQYGLSGMDSGSSGAATGTAAAASTTPEQAAEPVTNIAYYISNSAVAGSLDPLIGTLDGARKQKMERGA